ncbi:hypothetical protein D3C80_2230220 [compost metagenome]
MLQTAIGRQQETVHGLVATFGMGLFQLFQGHRLRQAERPGLGTPQLGNMGTATEQLA